MSRFQRVKMERPGAKSVFAFFLLPQFWRSMAHFSHIRPIFIQTLALMLAQAGLLPLNHPGARTGQHADGTDVRTSELMGEAWFNLRTRPHMGMYQWGIFCSILLMFICLVSAVVVVLMHFLSSSVAKAQIFQLQDYSGAPPTPIGTGLGDVPAMAGAGIYDRAGPAMGTGVQEDLAIAILDRVLRQAAMSSGGTMQNAILTMFGTYSTAVLVIASIVVFWAIVSIVIDTARTGQLGGGRHNMVWTPIRFVFALGLLVPIGGGFNSGQMMVMKLAEWGSNLGSNMWASYLTASSTGVFLLSANPGDIGSATPSTDTAPPPNAVNPTGSLLDPLITALTCMQRNNISNAVSGVMGPGNIYGIALDPAMPAWTAAAWGDPNPQYVRPMIDRATVIRNAPYINIHFGNATNQTLCGTLVMPNPNGNDILDDGGAYLQPEEIAQYKQANRLAEWNAINAIWGQMLHAACQFASITQQADHAGNANYQAICPNINFDGPGGYEGRPPGQLSLNPLVNTFTGIRNAANAAGAATLESVYLSPTGGFMLRARDQGWAGMGGWYFQLAGINRTFNQSRLHEATVSPGNEGGDGKTESAACAGAIRSTLGTLYNTNPGRMLVSAVTRGRYGQTVDGLGSKTWCHTKNTLSHLAGETLTDFIAGGGFSGDAAGDFPVQSLDDFNIDAGKRVIQWGLKKIQIPTENQNGLIVSIGGYGSTVHPMAQLASIGYSIVDKALYIYGAIAFISLFAAVPLIGGFVTALMAGPVGNLLGMLASFGLMPGLMLLYYVPLIPWTKVMFAVVAWIVSVVEAVVTIPVVALAHLRTDGEGLMGPMAQGAYVAWLNLLLRPGLTVIGFVMGNLIFEAMILFLNDTFNTALANMGTGGFGIIDQIINTYIYVFAAYALVNASFKLVDIIPNSTMSWLGTSAGTQDFSQEAGQTEAFIQQNAGELALGIGQTAPGAMMAPGMMAGGMMRGVGKVAGTAALMGGGALLMKTGALGKVGGLLKRGGKA